MPGTSTNSAGILRGQIPFTHLYLPSSCSQPRCSRSILLTLNLQGFTPKRGGVFAPSLLYLHLSCCKSPVQEAGCVPVTSKTFLATKCNCISSKVGVNIPTALSGKYFGLDPDVLLIQWVFWDKTCPSQRGAVMPSWMRERSWLRRTDCYCAEHLASEVINE